MEYSHPGLMHQHASKLSFLHRCIDAVVILLVLYASTTLYGNVWNRLYTVASLSAMVLFYLFSELTQLYRSWRGVPLRQQLFPLSLAWGLTCCSLLLLAYATKTTADFSRVAVSMWIILVPLVLTLLRVLIRSILKILRRHGRNSRLVAIVGFNESTKTLVNLIRTDELLMGLRLVGEFTDNSCIDATGACPIQQGTFADLLSKAKSGKIDLVYIALSRDNQEHISGMLTALGDTTASVYIVPDDFIFNLLNYRLIHIGSIPTISVVETPFYGIDGWLKRVEDLVLSSIILVIIAIPMLIISIVIKLTSTGTALFKQDRYGLNGRTIGVWKFRSMTVCENDPAKIDSAIKNDPRVTTVGKFIRKTSLDELPQFINVLIGTMSVVGPRPHANAHNEEYRKKIDRYMLRHKVKPGITGWAQINGYRGEIKTVEDMQKRVEYDLWYIQNWSLWLDVKIVFLTIFKGFVSPKAY